MKNNRDQINRKWNQYICCCQAVCYRNKTVLLDCAF